MVARAMENRASADALRDACMSGWRSGLGGWDREAGATKERARKDRRTKAAVGERFASARLCRGGASGRGWLRAGPLPSFEDQFHLLGDGHLDAVLAGEAESGAGGEHAFGDFAAEAFEDLGELAALAQRLADGAVAARASRCR